MDALSEFREFEWDLWRFKFMIGKNASKDLLMPMASTGNPSENQFSNFLL